MSIKNEAIYIDSKGFSNGQGSMNACEKKINERTMHIICNDSLLDVREV